MAAQIPDKILVNGERMDLYSNPLEPYWSFSGRRRPAFHVSPDCKRGYVASWEIRNSDLLLVGLQATVEKWSLFPRKKPAVYSIKSMFPKAKNKPVRVNWFSGRLRIPIGKMVLFEDSGYESRFEKEMIITVEKGHVLRSVTMDCSQKTLTVNTESLKPDAVPAANNGSSLQYVVSEAQGKAASPFAAAKVFTDGSDAVRYLREINKNKRLFVGDKELNLSVLHQRLVDRLSSISVAVEEEEKKWIIAAF